jgi:transcriptional regulator with XRE-family HTH domain
MTEPNNNAVESARKAAGMSQQQLAEAVGLTQSAISLIESDRRNLKLDVAARIARVLDVPLDSLVREAA